MEIKKSIIAAAAILAVASSSAAFAKAVTGTIKSVDKNGDSITLSDGEKFTLPEAIEVETLKVGEKVMVTYSTKAGKPTVSSIRAVQ
jgi:Cu/Ag efflux protein CusF